MLGYFDNLYVQIYNYYRGYQSGDVASFYALLVLSLFQTFNILTILVVGVGISNGGHWELNNIIIIVIQIAVFIFDYIRIHKIKGLENLLVSFNSREFGSEVPFARRPLFYFILSVALLISTKMIGFFPNALN